MRWTRSGQDSVQFYFDASDPYDNQYGWMKVGTDGTQTPNDLAVRVVLAA